MKNQKGVTLITLIILIIVLIILSFTSIYTGVEIYTNMQVQVFVTKMIAIQETVDKLCEQYTISEINNMGQSYNLETVPDKAKEVLHEVIADGTNLKSWYDIVDSNAENYRYFDINSINTILGIKNFDTAIWVNPTSRNVIAVEGIMYNDIIDKNEKKMYYRQYDLPDGKTLAKPNIITNFTLSYSVKTYNNKAEIILYKQNETVADGNELQESTFRQVKYYKKYGETYGDAKILKNVSKIELTESGIYKVEATDMNNNTIMQEDIIVTIVNKPLLVDGMQPIKYQVTTNDEGTTVSTIDTTTDDKDWYNYGENVRNWANAKLADGSIYVWIPRFAYEISTEEEQKINIKFLREFSNVGTDGETILSKYKVAPAFKDGTNNSFVNGEWDSEITGFWVAKYETTEETGKPKSYLINEQAWRGKTPSEAFNICRQMEAENKSIYFGDKIVSASGIFANGVYETDSNNIDTHLMKNSEWGAIAYLTHSKYGVESKETKKVSKAESYYIRDYNGEGNSHIDFSSNNNYTGIYGLNGGANELVAAGINFIYTDENSVSQSCFNSENKSTKYATLYLTGNISSDENKIYGDAMKETSNWNNNDTATITQLISRGGDGEMLGDSTGIFSYYNKNYVGEDSVTFRPILVIEY